MKNETKGLFDYNKINPIFTPNTKDEPLFVSLEPMEITITHTKNEEKISISNRLATYIEKSDLTELSKVLLSVVKELKK